MVWLVLELAVGTEDKVDDLVGRASDVEEILLVLAELDVLTGLIEDDDVVQRIDEDN